MGIVQPTGVSHGGFTGADGQLLHVQNVTDRLNPEIEFLSGISSLGGHSLRLHRQEAVSCSTSQCQHKQQPQPP